MSHRETKPLWLVQPRLDAAEYRDKLMGSVVKYPNLPTERRMPYRSPKMPKELVPDLDPKPIQVYNVKFWTRNIKDAKVSASVNELLEAFVERAREHSNEKVATVARMWHMDSPGEKFRELLRNKQYFEELFDLLRSSHDQQGYFITDIVTLVNLEVSDSTGSTTGAGAKAQVPVDPSTGIRVGAGGRFQVSREKGYSASYEGETIVFLGYRLVRLEKVDGTRARLRRVVLGQKHGFAVRDGFDYWPDLVEKPVEGNAEPFLAAQTPKVEEARQLGEQELSEEGIVGELGFDIQVVG
ncbi:hypothetical protein TOPH_03451 [Tolypocladium ophioglossoides CBS 100239]|uniref:Uncharacterized protein n=1 Tax=Tolypocladium ophioglossoides (strain CBS 100239) TaxID=1163406 RepID=A0A0L0NCW9_TOLOC|nr:hypothetical protein TOPH_03451 [Tolypocladium ophioglossoides CBS 100239]